MLMPLTRPALAPLVAVTIVAGLAASRATAFPDPVVFDPNTDVTAVVSVGSSVQAAVGQELVFQNGFFVPVDRPDILWFEYQSDGSTAVQFDLEGTNISTFGPHPSYLDGNYASLGFGTYDQTQMAVYNSSGQIVGRSSNGWYNNDGQPKLKRDFLDGPIIYIRPSDGVEVDFSDVVTHGLARQVFSPSATPNPRWSADPNDPTPVDPGQYGDKNEYEVWDTAIDDAINTPNGWRAGDRARYGPGARWDRSGLLPAGTYYIAITTGAVTFSGDQYPEEILQAPIHYDADTDTDDVPVLTEDMGPFEYYMPEENPFFPRQWGTIQLNVSEFVIPQPASLTVLAAAMGLIGRRRESRA